MTPERRLLLESMHGALTMKNGVPIGYVLFSSLFDSTEVAFNVFDTFRGAEAAHVLSRALAVGHRLRQTPARTAPHVEGGLRMSLQHGADQEESSC